MKFFLSLSMFLILCAACNTSLAAGADDEDGVIAPFSQMRVTPQRWATSVLVQRDDRLAYESYPCGLLAFAGHAWIVVEGQESEGPDAGKPWVYLAHATNAKPRARDIPVGEHGWHIETFGTNEYVRYVNGHGNFENGVRVEGDREDPGVRLMRLFNEDGTLTKHARQKLIYPTAFDEEGNITDGYAEFAYKKSVTAEQGAKITSFFHKLATSRDELDDWNFSLFDNEPEGGVKKGDGSMNCMGCCKTGLRKADLTDFRPTKPIWVPLYGSPHIPAYAIDSSLKVNLDKIKRG